MPSCFPTFTLDVPGFDAGPSGTRPTSAEPPAAGRALTTAELRRGKPDRRAFPTQPRLPIRVVLDGVRQGYNVGALFRLCDAFLWSTWWSAAGTARGGCASWSRRPGARTTGCPGNSATTPRTRCARPAPRVGRSSRSSKRSGPWTSPVSCPATPFAWCSARTGVSQAVLDLADAAVVIPVRGMANSLNVATAAAIVLHALAAPLTAGDRTP